MTILESILKSLRSAALYNKHELAAPRVILWPDEEQIVDPVLRPAAGELSRPVVSRGLFTRPGDRPGGLAAVPIGDCKAAADVPVIYLPGIGPLRFSQRRPMS